MPGMVSVIRRCGVSIFCDASIFLQLSESTECKKMQDMAALRSEAFVGGWESDRHIKHNLRICETDYIYVLC